jgi:two-component system sensor histidine kinase DctS
MRETAYQQHPRWRQYWPCPPKGNAHDPSAPPPTGRRGPRRTALWVLLVLLLVVAQSLLVALTVSYEATRSQDEIESIGAESAAQLRREMLQAVQQLQALSWPDTGAWQQAALALMRTRPELLRVERRGATTCRSPVLPTARRARRCSRSCRGAT